MAKMSGDEWLRYVVERALTAWSGARDESVRSAKEPWHQRWFGIVPMGVQLWWRKRKRQKPHAPGS